MSIEKFEIEKEHLQQEELSVRSLWFNRDYLLLWSGQVVSSVGTQISQYAFPLLLLSMTGSPLVAGFAFALRSLPTFLFSLWTVWICSSIFAVIALVITGKLRTQDPLSVVV